MERVILCLLLILPSILTLGIDEKRPYVKQCSRKDPKLKKCLIDALHHLRPFLRDGIPEIKLPAVEPFRIDELVLTLTGGPNGYKIQLRDMDILGASNFTVNDIDLGSSFQALVELPELVLNAHYSSESLVAQSITANRLYSSGVLIILPASGNGTFYGRFGETRAIVKGTVSTTYHDGGTYLHVDKLDLDIAIKNPTLRVAKIFNNNRILTEAINLFLRDNGEEVLKAMEPQLKKELVILFSKIVNQLLLHVPVESFLRQ